MTCECEWTLELQKPTKGRKRLSVAAGQQEHLPLRFDLPAKLPPGKYQLSATFRFSNGENQQDSFSINVLDKSHASSPSPLNGERAGVRGENASGPVSDRVALFDPKDETRALLKLMGIRTEPVKAGDDLSRYEILVIGKAALTVGGPAPDIQRVRVGLKVIVFEQTSEVLEKRFGFRVAEYGLRQVFPRIPDHPVLAGLTAENLHDWRGEATILPSRLKYELRPRYGPTVQWCDIPVTRIWRCGNRGNVVSVLIEKPARGDWLPILDGGYSLQYSPLMEYREGNGLVLFCQLDVTGRSEVDPAAEVLVRNLLRYVSGWKPTPRRKALYAGDPAGKKHLEAAGVPVTSYGGETLSRDQVLVVGPGGGQMLTDRKEVIGDWLKTGGDLLAIGLDEQQDAAFLPLKVATKRGEHISTYFEPASVNSLLSGIGPTEVHNRDPREFPLVSGGVQPIGDGILAKANNANVVFCQIAPWQFDPAKQMNLKRTYRRASVLVSRLLANMGAAGATPLLERFHQPLDGAKAEKRWLDGLYLDQPEEWDDPYRFFRW